METIGDNLLTILGMIPVRDRAGIARSNMAVEAQKSRQQLEGQGQPPPQFKPPQELVGQGGQLQIPTEMPTAFASGKTGTTPGLPAPRAGLSAPLAVPPGMPAGQERVIESSPAAAPSPAVRTQASDVLLAQMEQNQRRQKMMQVLSSVGMMINAFNRHPDAGQTQAQLAGMYGGGGGHGGGSGDLKTILDMREKEAATAASAQSRANAIGILKKKFNLSDEEAAAEVDLQAAKDRFGQGAEITRADRAAKAEARTRGIAELVKTRNLTPEQAAVEYDSDTYKDRFGQKSEQERADRADKAQAERDAVETLVKRGMSRADALVEVKSGAYTSRLGQAAEIIRTDRAAAEQARAKAREILIKRGLSPEEADVETATTVPSDRFGQESEAKRAERKVEDDLRAKLEPQIDDIARATGADPHILRAQLKAAGGPQKIMDQMSPEKRASVRKLESDANKSELEALPMAAKLAGWRRIIADPDAAEAAGITPQQAAEFRHNPTALNEFVEARAKKQGELGGARGSAAAAQQREAFVKTHHAESEAAESYLNSTGRQLGELLTRDDLPVGTFSELRQSGILRPLATALGVNIESLNSVAAVKSALNQAVIDNAKRLPGPASDKDTGLAASIAGSTETSIGEIRRVVEQTERARRRTIADNNARHERNKRTSPEMRGEFEQVPKIDVPEPSPLLQAEIFSKGNERLRADLRGYQQQMDAAVGTPNEKKAVKIYEKARNYFDDQFGAGTSHYYLSQERQ